jgi:hypothetical protein
MKKRNSSAWRISGEAASVSPVHPGRATRALDLRQVGSTRRTMESSQEWKAWRFVRSAFAAFSLILCPGYCLRTTGLGIAVEVHAFWMRVSLPSRAGRSG